MLLQSDIAVAVFLAEHPDATYDSIARTLSISLSTAHAGVARLRESQLMLPDGRRVNRTFLLEFTKGVTIPNPFKLSVYIPANACRFLFHSLIYLILTLKTAAWTVSKRLLWPITTCSYFFLSP